MSFQKNLKFFIRLIFWIIYFFSGYKLFSKDVALPSLLITFSRLVYPLSIFWIQIRINKKERWIEINPSMSTAQLWFRIIPVIASFITVIFSFLNLLLVIT